MEGYFSPPKRDLVGGHEGIGEVVAIGSGTVEPKVKLGQRVGIKYVAAACLNCEQCLSGNDCCTFISLVPFEIKCSLLYCRLYSYQEN